LLQPGDLHPDEVHLPGIYVHRIVKGPHHEKRIERLTVTKKGSKESQVRSFLPVYAPSLLIFLPLPSLPLPLPLSVLPSHSPCRVVTAHDDPSSSFLCSLFPSFSSARMSQLPVPLCPSRPPSSLLPLGWQIEPCSRANRETRSLRIRRRHVRQSRDWHPSTRQQLSARR
jgi:hypothetical protein